ncbi:hypothetical protein ACFFNY_16470 [Paenibacillus hodogayensis]|uniref:Uncharacterized protein n=1 Tax=Paenibacillus hodogayensis TaxID=279208 RepID=A0ABV5VXX7_9BACL
MAKFASGFADFTAVAGCQTDVGEGHETATRRPVVDLETVRRRP